MTYNYENCISYFNWFVNKTIPILRTSICTYSELTLP